MKNMKKTFDEEFVLYSDRLRGTYSYLLENLSKIIAILTASVAALLVFADIEFLGIFSREFSTTLILILISSYVCYFSLEEAGERLYEESEEYKARQEKYKATAGRVTVAMLPALRDYITRYTAEELDFRRGQMLLSEGLCEADLEAYLRGEITDRKRAATLRKIARARRLPITPELLLTPEEKGHQSVTDPKRGKYLALTLKILPSTLCMLLTASVVLTFKEMSVESVIEGILKLSTLPVVSLRGYAGGYNYKKYKEAPFIESKIGLLEGFLADI